MTDPHSTESAAPSAPPAAYGPPDPRTLGLVPVALTGSSPSPSEKVNTVAIVALVLGGLGTGFGVAPIVLGHIALRQIRQGEGTGRGLAIAGLVLGYVVASCVAVVLALALIGGFSRGVSVLTGQVPVAEVARGECFTGNALDNFSSLVRVVSCDEPHTFEVIAVLALDTSYYPGEARPFPGEERGLAIALDLCATSFEPLWAADDTLEGYVLSPTALDWYAGTTWITCVAGDPALPAVVGTADRMEIPDTHEPRESVPVNELQVGDCFDEDELGVSAFIIPCSEPHVFEVFAMIPATTASSTFPGEEAVRMTAERACVAAFENSLGTEIKDSAFDLRYAFPYTSGTWMRGDAVRCYVTNWIESPRRGSALPLVGEET